MSRFLPLLLASSLSLSATGLDDRTPAVALPILDASRLTAPDLNADGHADLVVRLNERGNSTPRVFLWAPDDNSALHGHFAALADAGLPELSSRDVLTFADLNNDGHPDALIARYLDYLQPQLAVPTSAPPRTAWLPGHGDGTFGAPHIFIEAPAATTAAIAVGDANADGLPDVWLGNWYERYDSGYDAFSNDLLLQYPPSLDQPDSGGFVRWSIPGESSPPDITLDPAGRPTYGVAFARLDDGALPYLIELNYGRRWNRLYALTTQTNLPALPASGATPPPRPAGPLTYRREEIARTLRGTDIAPASGFDGDTIRHGRHPKWIEERAKDDPRFKREDEPPFRANGNTFDVAIGDIDNDGDFDLFVSTIIHAWAGDSSDRSRFLVNRLRESGQVRFDSPLTLSVDRIPAELTPETRNYNQGDIFCELADFNNDGHLDLVLCSSDYSDPPPFDERLRVYLQQPDGTFADCSTALGLDHLGAGQPAIVDLDHDGALDLIVGQSFNRLTAERRREAGLANGSLTTESPADARPTPRLRVYHNTLAAGHAGLVLRLRGDPTQGITRDAFGTVVRASVDLDGDPATPDVWLTRQLVGPGGHAGKRSDTFVHFGLGQSQRVNALEIIWPNTSRTVTTLGSLDAGTWIVDQSAGSTPQRFTP